MKHPILILSSLLVAFGPVKAAEESITWLVQYDATSLPQEQGWKAVGELASKATLANGALHLVDDSATAHGAFRATWKTQPGTEIVVEATVRVESVSARKGRSAMWPAQQGVPVGDRVGTQRVFVRFDRERREASGRAPPRAGEDRDVS